MTKRKVAKKKTISESYHEANKKYKKTGNGFGVVLSLQRKLERSDSNPRNSKKKVVKARNKLYKK